MPTRMPTTSTTAARLLGAGLLTLTALTPMNMLVPHLLRPGLPTAAFLSTMVMAFIVGLLSVISAKLAGRRDFALVALLVYAVVPVMLAAAATDHTAAHTRAICIFLPTVVAAALMPDFEFVLQLVLATMGFGILLKLTGMHLPHVTLFALVLESSMLFAALLTRRLFRTTHRRIAALKWASQRDALTGLLNRRGLVQQYPAFAARIAHTEGTVSVLLMDLDFFKKINDKYGHKTGDDVLKAVVARVQAHLEPGELLARIGGEELVAVLHRRPHDVAEAIRAACAGSDKDPCARLSIGTVEMSAREAGTVDLLCGLIQVADQALFVAKNSGRNKVIAGNPAQVRPLQVTVPVPAAPAIPAAPARVSAIEVSIIGWWMFSVPALVAYSVTLTWRLPWSYFMSLSVIAGLTLIGVVMATIRGYQPLLRPAVLISLVVAADGLVIFTDSHAAGLADRRAALVLLLGPALLVARYLDRRFVIASHCLIALCTGLILSMATTTELSWVNATIICTVVLIACPEILYRLRMEHDRVVEQLHCWAVTDPLTGLANRRGLEMAYERLNQRSGVMVSVADIDDFKNINDRYGHAGGDRALVAVAGWLQDTVGPYATAARIGGDEFAVLFPAGVRPEHGIVGPIPVDHWTPELMLTISVGTAEASGIYSGRLPETDSATLAIDLWELIAQADVTLIANKNQRRSRRDIQLSQHH